MWEFQRIFFSVLFGCCYLAAEIDACPEWSLGQGAFRRFGRRVGPPLGATMPTLLSSYTTYVPLLPTPLPSLKTAVMRYYTTLFLSSLFILFTSCAPTLDSDVTTDSATEIASTRPSVELEPNRYNVAFLIMDGVYNTELTAPYDIFQHTIFRDSIKAMNTFLVANTLAPVTTFEGLQILPHFNYLSDSLPSIDILVIPSAEHHLDSDLEDKAMLDFVRRVAKDAMFITSHCDGAFVLAEAGLLRDKVSTTFPSDITAMRERYPDHDIREDVLFVHDGQCITSAGGAKSFEAALYLCEYLYGAEVARRLAKGLVIDWKLEEVPHLVIE